MDKLKHYFSMCCASFTVLFLIQSVINIFVYASRPFMPQTMLRTLLMFTVVYGLQYGIDVLLKINYKKLAAVQYVASFIVLFAVFFVSSTNAMQFSWIPFVGMVVIFSAIFFVALGINSIKAKKDERNINKRLEELNKPKI